MDTDRIELGRSVGVNDIISVSYEASAPSRIDNFPTRHTRAIIRNIGNLVNEDNRYSIQYRKNFTDDSNVDAENKLLHREWKMFRQHQQNRIDEFLWNKVIESMLGHTLDDDQIIVPSVSRQLYDTQHSDTTRFGLDAGQTFVDGQQAITTLFSDINDPENEFRGIDISAFLRLNDFSTPEGILSGMRFIYDIFPVEDVNRLYFLFLNDALSNETEYAKLLKTSMISVFGVKVLDTGEAFDE